MGELQDRVVGWINHYFAFNIKNEFQFTVCFPLLVLSMLDAIYPKRVRWREVDWRFQYRRALNKNYATLFTTWSEVNMEKAKEFRVENTPLRCETIQNASVSEKLDFLHSMKCWFEQRIHSCEKYDPLQKRRA